MSLEPIIESPKQEDDINETTFDYEIPDGSLWGWIQVLINFMITFIAWGGNTAFSLYLSNYLETNAFQGSPLDFATIGGLSFGGGFVFAPLITYLSGITSPNFVIFIGAILQFVSVFSSAYCKKLWQLYLSQGLLSGISLAMVAIPVPAIIPQWFDKYRHFVLLFGASGSGLGGIMFNLAIDKIIGEFSVNWAKKIQAIMSLTICLICSFFVKTRNEKIKPELKIIDWQLVTYTPFIILIFWIIFTLLGYVAVQYSITNATLSLGYSNHQASISIVIFSAGSFVGRPILGLLSDKYGAFNIGLIVYCVSTITSLAIWLPARNLATMYAFSILGGGIMGFIFGAIGAIVPKIVGIKKSPVGFGMAWMIIGASGIVSPIIGLSLKKELPVGVTKLPNEYEYCALFSGLSYFVALLIWILLRSYLISRDSLSKAIHDDDDQINVRVPNSLVIKNLFNFHHVKQI